ncbi:hypothetical protein [Acinetobacter puyangensis]|uniref:hypothetical protein n=1 Tax=Acinetobacter puyangensis TaxID=1096779 RepID=UPI003A4DE46A
MNSIVKFPTPPMPEPQPELPVDLDDPMVKALLAEVDDMVSFDLNTSNIEELRLNTRLMLVRAYYDNKRYQMIMQLLRVILSDHRKKELSKYLSSGKSDDKAAAKALAFNRAICLIPRKFPSSLLNPQEPHNAT